MFPYDDQEQIFEPNGAVVQYIEDYKNNHGGKSPVVETQLVYLQGCEALHGPSNDKADFNKQCAVKECVAHLFKLVFDGSKASMPAERKPNFTAGLKDAKLVIPEKATPMQCTNH